MSEPRVKDLADRIAKLESTADTLKRWAAILGVLAGVFGLSLAATWNNISDARKQANEARDIANKAVGALNKAKADATTEIKAEGTHMLEGYKSEFTK